MKFFEKLPSWRTGVEALLSVVTFAEERTRMCTG
jgi:hypothetical protein